MERSEDDISDWIPRLIAGRLGRGRIVDREIQVDRRKSHGVGTRIDLTATAPTVTPIDTARVIVDEKFISNSTSMNMMRDQLVQQYLMPTSLQNGIYLVTGLTR